MRSVVIAIVVIVGMMGMVGAASPAGDGHSFDHDDLRPGEAVSGAIAGGDADVQGEIEVRAFGHQLQNATAEERAELIAERLASDNETLDTLEERASELESELNNGTITHGQYLAELNRIVAQSNAIELAMNRSAGAAVGLEAELGDVGVSVTDITEIRERAGQGPPGIEDGIPGLGDREPGPPFDDSDDLEIPGEAGNETEQPDDRPGN